MSNRLTFSLASLIILFVAGVVLLPPSTAEAAPPTFGGQTQADLTFTTDVTTTGILLPAATDPEGDSITYTLQTSGDSPADLGGGLSFAAGTRLITGTPTTAGITDGAVEYTYTASSQGTGDTAAVTATLTFNITVLSDVTFAAGTEIMDLNLKVGDDVFQRLPAATDGSGNTPVYAIAVTVTDPVQTGNLAGTGLTFDPATRLLSGTATEQAETDFTYTATDNDDNGVASLTFKITVTAPTTPVFATGAAIPNITGKVGEAITVTQLPAATDADGDTVTHSLSPALPAGLMRDDAYVAVAGADPIMVIRGTPTAAMAETAYTWTAMSEDDEVELMFNITIAAADPVAPGAPTAVTATADQTANTITVSWTAPDDGGSPITAYTVTKSYMMDGAPATKVIDAGTATTVTIPPAGEDPLPQGVNFTFTVTATNSVGEGPASAASNAVMIDDDTPVVTDPDPDIAQPTNVMAEAQNDGSVMVTWAWAGADATETAALAGFTVMWDGQSAMVAADMMSHTIPASMVTAGESTMVSVMARAMPNSGYMTPAAGTDAPSAVTPVDPNALRFAPGTMIPNQTFEVGKAIGTTAMPYIQLPIAHGGSLDKTYTLHKGAGKVDVTAGDNGLTVDLVNLRLMGTPMAEDTGTMYIWRAANVQQAGDVEVVVELSFMITVNAATIVTPTNMAPVVMIITKAPTAAQTGTFTIAYTATDDGNPAGSTLTETVTNTIIPSAAAGYTVTPDDATNMVTITQAATADHAVITVTITSSDGDLTSDPKSIEVPFAAVTPPDPPDPLVRPGAPILTTATPGNQQVTLTWTTPTTGDVGSYQYSLNVGETWIDIPNSTAATTSHIVTTHADGTTRLANGQNYSLAVRAINAEHMGPSSNRLVATPRPDPVTPPTPDTTKPTVTIAATPAIINCDTGSALSFTFSEALAAGEAVAATEVSASAGWSVTAGGTTGVMLVPKRDGSEIGVTSVTVTVAANAVKDASNNGNAAKSMTFTVGPVLNVPANSYIVVIRPEHANTTHLRTGPLYLGSLGVAGAPVNIQYWECMPDLTVFFGRSGAGSGGGALVLKKAHTHAGAINTGSVGISEIMWASDEGTIHGLTSNTQQAREQWIEIHNTNNFAVALTIFARPTNAALVTQADELDRASNYEIGNSWVVKGQNGNSALGTDFVSMFRHKNGHPYSHGDNNGKNGGKWNASTLVYRTIASSLAGRGATNPVHNFKGTPGRSNTIGPATPPLRTNVPNSPIVINEVANRSDQALEWIELKNVSDGTVNLRNYHISIVTGVNSEKPLFTFPNNNNTQMAAGSLLLLVASDPRYNDDHPVAVGRNIHSGNDQARGIGADAPRYVDMSAPGTSDANRGYESGGLPDNGEFILMVRRPDGVDKHNTARNKMGKDGNMIDAVGYHPNLKATGSPLYTNLWPLKVYGTARARSKMEVDTVHYRRVRNDPDQGDNNKPEQIALNNVGYTGIGYKRHAQKSVAHGGTPGYEHSWTALGGGTATAAGSLTISEIMIDQGDGRYPQWIEIYNGGTQSVDLRGGKTGWKLVIHNFDDGEIPIARLSGTLNFRSSDIHMIQPGQTVLVTSTRARGSAGSGSAFFDTSVVFPPTRVFSVWDDARGEFGQARSTDPILSTEGFYIELIDGGNDARTSGYVSDAVGNLIPNPGRRVATQNTIEWSLTDITGEAMEGEPRSSIMRRYRKPMGGDFRDRTNAVAWPKYTATELRDLGIMAEGWVLASKTDFRDVSQTWYGHGTDIGSPGISTGRVLPVELAKFRPERLEDGSVAIRWITESETNNAGFNILRSESKTGEFTKLNTQLIAGQETTSERTPYEFVDKTAKPNVVYYYQIQDVSLDGDVQTLAVTHLRGHVSAAGKATTTWGDIKSLQ